MKTVRLLVAAALLAATTASAQDAKPFVGLITDTMCGANHASMKVTPDARCVKECIGHGNVHKYALLVARNVYTLSDQETPARFAGRKVKVVGVLYPKTNILKVDSISAVE